MAIDPLKLDKKFYNPFITPFNDADNEVFLDNTDNNAHALGGNDSVHGNGGNDIIFGDQGYDALWGDEGDDNLYGGTENDWLAGGPGRNFLDGGLGIDDVVYVWYKGPAEWVHINLAENWGADGGSNGGLPTRGNGLTFNDTYGLATDTPVLEAGIERAWGATNTKNYIVGNSKDNYLQGGGKDDVVFGNGGNDFLQGNEGNDGLFGGEGHDVMYGGTGNDTLAGGQGNDRFYGNAGADYFSSGGGADAFYFQKDAPYRQAPGANSVVNSAGIDFIGKFGPDDHIYLYDATSQIVYFNAGSTANVEITWDDGSKGTIGLAYEGQFHRENIHIL